MTTVTVRHHDDRLVAVKGSSPETATRRRAEAELLARLDHPGIVPYLDHTEGPTPELHLGYVGPDAWDGTPPTTAPAILEGIAALTATVADLHEAGTCHGALSAEHVLVAADGRPVLCGFGDAVPAEPAGCAADVAALAGLIGRLASQVPAEERAPLEALAHGAIERSLSARELTDELHAAALADARPRHRHRHRSGMKRFRRRSVLAGGALMAAAAAALLIGPTAARPDVTTSQKVGSPVPAPPSRPTAPLTTSTLPTSADEPLPTVPPPPTTTPGPDVGPAVELVHDGRRYGVGSAGDIAVIGDWDCDGVETAALLQSDTGLVAVFAEWPAPGEEGTQPTSSVVVEGAEGLEAVPAGDCHQLRVLDEGGSSLVLPEFS